MVWTRVVGRPRLSARASTGSVAEIVGVKTDAFFYRVFQEIQPTYFELIGASESAADYTFASEELKQAGMRLDGIFLPKRAGKPVHFVEVFFYKTPHAYSNLFAKVFLWLETKNPAQ